MTHTADWVVNRSGKAKALSPVGRGAEVRRLVDAAELKSLRGLAQSFWDELPAGAYPPKDAGDALDFAHLAGYWSQLLELSAGALWVLEARGVPVGFLQAVIYHDRPTGKLVAGEEYWYVTPEARTEAGGPELWAAFRRWGRECGAEYVTGAWSVPEYRAPLEKFYAAAGFSQIAGIFMRKA